MTTKMMVYQISVKGIWEYVAEAIRLTEEAIESTKPAGVTIFSGTEGLENRLIDTFPMPDEGESFSEYTDTFRHMFPDSKGPSLQFIFVLDEDEGCSLRVETITRKGRFQATFSATGDYVERGLAICEDIHSSLDLVGIVHGYTTLER